MVPFVRLIVSRFHVDRVIIPLVRGGDSPRGRLTSVVYSGVGCWAGLSRPGLSLGWGGCAKGVVAGCPRSFFSARTSQGAGCSQNCWGFLRVCNIFEGAFPPRRGVWRVFGHNTWKKRKKCVPKSHVYLFGGNRQTFGELHTHPYRQNGAYWLPNRDRVRKRVGSQPPTVWFRVEFRIPAVGELIQGTPGNFPV